MYRDGLVEGWGDWSWGVVVDPLVRDVLGDGRTMLSLTHAPFSGFRVHRAASIPSSGVLYFTASPAMLNAGTGTRARVSSRRIEFTPGVWCRGPK